MTCPLRVGRNGMSRAQGSRTMRGFTLVELMIVVVIIGVLGAVAVYAYRKQVNRAREAEVSAMMGEFRAKEEAYRTEFGAYKSTGADESAIYPVLGTCISGSVEPCPKVITKPQAWIDLGINPQRTQLYCGYVAVAGAAGTAPSGHGAMILGAAVVPTPWYWLYASC